MKYSKTEKKELLRIFREMINTPGVEIVVEMNATGYFRFVGPSSGIMLGASNGALSMSVEIQTPPTMSNYEAMQKAE